MEPEVHDKYIANHKGIIDLHKAIMPVSQIPKRRNSMEKAVGKKGSRNQKGTQKTVQETEEDENSLTMRKLNTNNAT